MDLEQVRKVANLLDAFEGRLMAMTNLINNSFAEILARQVTLREELRNIQGEVEKLEGEDA